MGEARAAIPSCVSSLQLGRSDPCLPGGTVVIFQCDRPLHASLSLPVKFRPHHSQSQVWNFCVHLDEGLQCYASSGFFWFFFLKKAGAVPVILPHF